MLLFVREVWYWRFLDVILPCGLCTVKIVYWTWANLSRFVFGCRCYTLYRPANYCYINRRANHLGICSKNVFLHELYIYFFSIFFICLQALLCLNRFIHIHSNYHLSVNASWYVTYRLMIFVKLDALKKVWQVTFVTSLG